MNIIDTLTAAANSAPTGAVAGSSGLGGLLLDIAPEIGRWLFSGTGNKFASLLAQAVETVTGTSDADAALKALARNPDAVSALRLQIIGIVTQQHMGAERAAAQAAVAEPAATRRPAPKLIHLQSVLAWAPAILSGVILVVFGMLIFVVLTKTNLTPDSLPLANVLLGTVAAMATQVANYWLGSSSGSAAKSDQMAALSAAAQSLVPSDVVHRLMQQPGPAARPAD